jgi:hypothetical protein
MVATIVRVYCSATKILGFRPVASFLKQFSADLNHGHGLDMDMLVFIIMLASTLVLIPGYLAADQLIEDKLNLKKSAAERKAIHLRVYPNFSLCHSNNNVQCIGTALCRSI